MNTNDILNSARTAQNTAHVVVDCVGDTAQAALRTVDSIQQLVDPNSRRNIDSKYWYSNDQVTQNVPYGYGYAAAPVQNVGYYNNPQPVQYGYGQPQQQPLAYGPTGGSGYPGFSSGSYGGGFR